MKNKLKVILQRTISFLIEKLRRIDDVYKNENNEKIEGFEDLTPKDNVDIDGKYSKAMEWALKNNKIKNIALTGSYGSGKSSLLKTFEKLKEKEYKFINISLLTFQNVIKTNDTIDTIERSILQQMFYKVQDKAIPFSRFRRIKNLKNIRIQVSIFLFAIFFFSVSQIFIPSILKGVFSNTFFNLNIKYGETYKSLLVVYMIIYLFIVMGMIYKFLHKSVKLSKISFSKATIEMAPNSENSIFSKYIDEILYFFEATKYNVVIFEDLDRFENLDIFESLRELNTLINNAEKVNRKVVFIYAVKDDMFGKDDEMFISRNRTKFFDFIIPVIPIINSSNSSKMLMERLRNSSLGKEITENFVNDITTYIDDMRLLINISNEFIVYQNKLVGINLIANNLLAMIVYKNIYPADFAKLQFNEGMVFECLQKKEEIITKNIAELDKEISRIENDIKSAESETLSSINELVAAYADALVGRQTNFYIEIDGTINNITNITSDFFERLKSATRIRSELGRGITNSTKEQIETVFGTKESYYNREKSIKLVEQKMLDGLKVKLESLNKEKQEVTSWSLKELIARSEFEVFTGNIQNEKLLKFLIRNGYIDNMYQQYITYFYPGSLTTEDMKFIMSVLDHEVMPFDYQLTKLEKIINRLHGNDFKRPEILNYDLLEFIIASNDSYSRYFESIMSQLGKGTEKSVIFIDTFKEVTKNKEKFIRSICKEWQGMWKYVELESNFSKEKQDGYLVDIIIFADIKDIVAMNRGNILRKYISHKENFIKLIAEAEHFSKVKAVLLELQVKFVGIDHTAKENELFTFVYENNLYEINNKMINMIMDATSDEDQSLTTLNYTEIKNSNRKFLIDYINENIDEFVGNVLLKQEVIIELEETMIDLLNREEISLKNKEAIIDKQNTLISDIIEVENSLWNKLINSNKVKITWSNFINYYKEVKELDDALILFIKHEQNSTELSKYKIKDMTDFESSTLKEISEQIINSRAILDEQFEKLVYSVHHFISYPTKKLSPRRAEIMINNNVLSLSTANFDSLKENFQTALHILLIEKNVNLYLEEQENYQLNSNDLLQIVGSNIIKEVEKNQIIKNMNVTLITEDIKLAEVISKQILDHNVDISIEIYTTLMETDIDVYQKIRHLLKRIKQMENEDITEQLIKLKGPYADLIERKRPLIKDNEVNRALIAELQNKYYISSWKEEGGKLRINPKNKLRNII